MNIDKSKWKNIHYDIQASRVNIENQIRELDNKKERAKKAWAAQEELLQRRLDKIRDKCPHIDDGGPFVACCSVCGWMDYFDA